MTANLFGSLLEIFPKTGFLLINDHAIIPRGGVGQAFKAYRHNNPFKSLLQYLMLFLLLFRMNQIQKTLFNKMLNVLMNFQ